ncbi:hypothetical protein [Mesorhizobium sp.]|uniref:hypothetical protein n=1 Tax=Mesorhizobium sp. TaxID=1871066 RepID=UPI0025D8ED0F|nr:hypothetical protein [Mesorhizobium sp.]
MSVAGSEEIGRQSVVAGMPAWLWVGVAVGLLMMLSGNALLNDPDMFWQIKVGQWIVDHGAVPHVDIYSFSKAGTPWISSSWLAQVLFAYVYGIGGWGGVVALAAIMIAATLALLVYLLDRHLPSRYSCLIAMVALALASQHMLARPHVLVIPIMVVWFDGLIVASDRRVAPSLWLLPLIVLWANLHGSFILGLALLAPTMFDAMWQAPALQRRKLAGRWIAFGIAAVVTACATPYGWQSLWAAKNILDLGPALSLISEWAPPNFSRFEAFEIVIMLLATAALWRGVRLPLPRIVLVLGFLHMALSHVRNVEVFALLTPLALAGPVAHQFGWTGAHTTNNVMPRSWSAALVALLLAVAIGWNALYPRHFQPNRDTMPTAAVAVLKDRKATRVFNDYNFGGYLIWAGVAPFFDGRTELYGVQFSQDVFAAQALRRPDLLLSLLERYRIDATLLAPTTPAAILMDHLEGWTRVYADDKAVVHMRTSEAGNTENPAPARPIKAQ